MVDLDNMTFDVFTQLLGAIHRRIRFEVVGDDGKRGIAQTGDSVTGVGLTAQQGGNVDQCQVCPGYTKTVFDAFAEFIQFDIKQSGMLFFIHVINDVFKVVE